MSTSSFGLLLLLAVVGFIAFMSMRTKRTAANLGTFLQQRGFTKEACTLDSPFPYNDMTSVECYAGSLGPGIPAKLLLGRRRGTSIIINGVPTAQMEEYVGLYLPGATARGVVTEAWMARWPADPDSRSKKPLRVVRTPDAGVLFNWRCELNQSNVQERLELISQGLPERL